MPVDDHEGRWFVAYQRPSWLPLLYGLLVAAGVIAFAVALVEVLLGR
jgi:hypothetical protein